MLVSCLSSKLTKQYTETVDRVLGTITLSSFHPDTTALDSDCTSKSMPNMVKTKQLLWLRAQQPHRMQGLGITSTPRRSIRHKVDGNCDGVQGTTDGWGQVQAGWKRSQVHSLQGRSPTA
jgi:hypothetical protein